MLKKAVFVGAAIATLISAAVLLRVQPRRSPREQLNEAAKGLTRRSVAARLVGIDFSPLAAVVRSGETVTPEPHLVRLRATAAEIWSSDVDPSDRAVAALLAGAAGDALHRLEEVIARNDVSATSWSDLAATRLTLGSAQNDTAMICAALAAADRSIALDPSRLEPQFNRALILESLSLQSAAAKAYAAYLVADGRSPWADEARQRLAALRKAAVQPAWRESLEQLVRFGTARNETAIRRLAMESPEIARTASETEILGQWGAAVAADDQRRGDSLLFVARAIGRTLQQFSGESLLADAVVAIDRADQVRRHDLAAGHLFYREARQLYSKRDLAGTMECLDNAERRFETAGSSMALLTAYYRLSATLDSGQQKLASTMLQSLETRTPSRDRALVAQLDWLRGTIRGKAGLLEPALEAYRGALLKFEALREQQNATEMRNRIAGILTMLGRDGEAWPLRGANFAVANESRDSRRVQASTYAAASAAVRERRWDIAHALLNVTVDIADGNPRVFAEALVWRALAAKKAQLNTTAANEIESAVRGLAALSDPGLREEVRNDLRFVEALVVTDSDPRRAVELLTDYVVIADRRAQTARIPDALVERARARDRMHQPELARDDYLRAIDRIEATGTPIVHGDLRDSFLGKSSTAYDRLAELYDRTGDMEHAVQTLDRRRLHALGVPQPAFATVNRAASDGILLTYGIFDDRLVIYESSRGAWERFSLDVHGTDLQRSMDQFVQALSTGNEPKIIALSRSLDALLIPRDVREKAASSLAIVADGGVRQLPFAALSDDSGRFLIERYSIAMKTSIAVGARRDRSNAQSMTHVVVVGDPSLDPNVTTALPPLHAAAREATDIAALYSSASVLLGERATESRVRSELPNADLAHFAVHGVLDANVAWNSYLMLTSDASADGKLTVAEIGRLRLQRLRVVVLAGCETGVAGKGYGDTRTLAAAFLAAGAQNVIASLWDIDDTATVELSRVFHEELRRGNSPAEALRAAQLKALHSPNAVQRDPRNWSALQLYTRN